MYTLGTVGGCGVAVVVGVFAGSDDLDKVIGGMAVLVVELSDV